jgi:hypothetical protein
MKKHTNIGKSLELRIARVIYQVRQITHRAITKNKRDQVIVTMHASKLKMYTRRKAYRSPRLLLELEHSLNLTLDSQQGFAYSSTTKLKPLQLENYK